MVSRKLEFSVGLFVAAGLTIAIILIIWLGINKFFKKGDVFYIFLNESVRGLNIDSPVSFRGVPVGRVIDIDVAQDLHLIQITIQVNTGTITNPDQMVAQMNSIGITGNAFIDLDMQEPPHIALLPEFANQMDHPAIPSRPSNITLLFSHIEEFAHSLDKVDLLALSKSAQELIENTNALMSGLKQTDIPKKMDTVMQELQDSMRLAKQAISRIDSVVDANQEYFGKMIRNMASLTGEAATLMNNGTRVANNIEALTVQAQRLMRKLESSGNNLNKLLNVLTAQPSMLLFSEPAEERKYPAQTK